MKKKIDLHMAPHSLVNYYMCFYFQKGSFLRAPFFQYLGSINANGLVGRIYRKELRSFPLPISTETPKAAEAIHMIDIRRFGIMYFCCIVYSLLVFGIECFLYFILRK